ncbi:NADP-dependent oxidoreductase [Tenacibaculum sp. C7A-26P2]|uniref:NADP-dependent oxidoreductase n=1 Tax=Tenacibaculum sp. C7A-26P2 TaxID=3447504 RepID=UPI003F82F446
MKAVQFKTYGEVTKSVVINEVDKPIIKEDEVLIEVYASSVNPLDLKVLEGTMKDLIKLKLPSTLGYDVSGVIIEKGKNVIDFKVGDEVYSKVIKQGTFSEFVAVKQSIVGLKPKNITFEEAASLPLVGLTAIQSLKKGKLKKGEKILIHAGSGGVGSFAIQYAKLLGAYVYTTTSTKNIKWVKELGADIVIDYRKENYREKVKDVDVVLDTLGNRYTEEAFDVVKVGGKVITLVGPVDKETAKNMKLGMLIRLYLAWKRRKITKQIKIKSAYYSLVLMRAKVAELNEIKDLVESEKIKVIIDRVFELKDSLKALLYVKKGHTKGKVVINFKS